MKIIVAGSRTWEGPSATDKVAWTLGLALNFSIGLGEQLTLVHGDCPRGADAIADRWARRRVDQGVELITYPAQWGTYGKQAGFVRNKVMVEAGADMVLAFLRDNSRGTLNTVALARAAGISTKVIDWDPEWPEWPESKPWFSSQLIGL